MSPGAIVQAPMAPPISTHATTSPSPPQQHKTTVTSFDDIFHAKFMDIIREWKDDPTRGQLTQRDRKVFIETAFSDTDDMYFGNRLLSDHEIRLRALTKVFYKVLAEEPWSEDWIRAPDVERKLSKFEMHKDSVARAAEHNLITPRDAVKAAREASLQAKEALKEALKAGKKEKDVKIPRGPYDDIEIVYIAGTVSSTATNRIDRDNIYPVSVSSVANVLQNHICRDMVRPFSMAERFINCTDTRELEDMRQFACNVCDFAPHLLDNDNVSLLVVLLILPRSDCCRRFLDNGIRIEGSTISHRKAECMKNKMGWRTTEDKKPYDSFANEFQARVRNACFPAPRAHNLRGRKPTRKPSTPVTPAQYVYNQPHMGYVASPQVRSEGVHTNTGINVAAPTVNSIYSPGSGPGPGPEPRGIKRTHTETTAGDSAAEPMDLS